MPTILITGANRGIGFEFVKQYLAEGWKVIATSRHPEKLDKLTAHPNQLINLKLDLTDLQQIESIAKQLGGTPIDILLNNAGILYRNNCFAEIQISDETAWLDTFKINTMAPFYVAKAFTPHVAASNLKIIASISSSLSSISHNHSSDYYFYRASKCALNMTVRNLSIDLKEKGITALALDPGWVKTDMGGLDADLNVEESVDGLRKVLSQASLKDSGKFYRYDGGESAW